MADAPPLGATYSRLKGGRVPSPLEHAPAPTPPAALYSHPLVARPSLSPPIRKKALGFACCDSCKEFVNLREIVHRDAAACGVEGSLRRDVCDVRSVGCGSSRVVPNAVAVRLAGAEQAFWEDLLLLFYTLAPQVRTGEAFR
jgi:hypothetical protein